MAHLVRLDAFGLGGFLLSAESFKLRIHLVNAEGLHALPKGLVKVVVQLVVGVVPVQDFLRELRVDLNYFVKYIHHRRIRNLYEAGLAPL